MTWLLTALVALLTSVASGALAGIVASMAVDWYHIPSREGGSGFFVLGFVVLGLIGGLIVGVVTSRIVAGRPEPGFLKALGMSLMALVSVVTVIGGAARLLADVSPTIDGKTLLLNVELRWPEGAELPADSTGGWFLALGSGRGGTVRKTVNGPLWREDARKEGGRWIVPGAVDLYTSRGYRLIMVDPQGVIPTGFEVPVPAWPGRKALAWSEWLPKLRPGVPSAAGGVTYRWRLVPEDQPVRTQRFGDFEVATIASSVSAYAWSGEPRTWSASAKFAIGYRGTPVVIASDSSDPGRVFQYPQVDAVALMPGADTALLVLVNGVSGSGEVWLVEGRGSEVRTRYIAHGGNWASAPLVTSDSALFARSRPNDLQGRVDETRFSVPGLYLFPGVLFDTRTRLTHAFESEGSYNILDHLPPLGLSPDERSFVRVGYDPDSSDQKTLEVFSTDGAERYRLPLDFYRMRVGEADDLTPADVAGSFEWKRGADGRDRLVPRAHPVPRPYTGVMSSNDPGYREYRLHLATEGLRTAMVDWLVNAMQGERLPVDSGAYAEEVRVRGQVVYLSWSEADGHVGVWVDSGTDTRIVLEIARRFNAALATGRYDRFFVTRPPEPAGEPS
ncbi:MAG: hypothetical protein U0133_08010 [Gemmatimonadales bacterium]